MARELRLTKGSKTALRRLCKGGKLEREFNRSLIQWATKPKVALHHLTFKNLTDSGVLRRVSGRSGCSTYGVSVKGRRLLN